MVLCTVLCLCSCGKKETNTEKKDTAKTSVSEAGKSDLKTVINEKGKKIVDALGTMGIDEVLDDIKNIDLYLEPDFNEKEYTVKTVEDTENGTKDVNYYSGDNLVYTKYEGYGEEGFANYTKTASGLDATVKYYTDSGDNRTVCIETPKYSVFANTLNKEDSRGLGDTNIILISENEKSPFECSATYYYDNGTATFENAVYLESGNYQRYSYGVDPEGIESEFTDVLVYGSAPKISDDIIKVLQSDKSYKYAAIEIAGSTKWYNADNKWYVEAEFAIVMDNEKQAEEYIKKNNLKATVDDYGSIIVKIDKVFLPIDPNTFLEKGKLPEFISGETEDSFFRKITLDNSGMITELAPSDISIY